MERFAVYVNGAEDTYTFDVTITTLTLSKNIFDLIFGGAGSPPK
jgi:hypothetical protein